MGQEDKKPIVMDKLPERVMQVSTVRIAATQAPEFLNDLSAALQFLRETSDQADAQNVHLLAFPEGFLQGYIIQEEQARELAIDVGSPRFQELLKEFPISGPMLVVGMIERAEGKLFNTAIVVKNQKLLGTYRKHYLLTGEAAFTEGQSVPVFEVQGLKFCINICYDMNFPDLADQVARQSADLIVCCANNMLKHEAAEKYRSLHNSVRGQRCQETGLWLISSDVTGERKGHLALGPTAVLNPKGSVVSQLPLGQVGLLVFDLPKTP
ncbi:apolipoprotein N-acyltransferase [Pseudovibrio japonicus]|uniref:Apolipoprotein N-acyltransferase n=1 Tax=Pseudovibrio japonicus TaxID=366534 RepID=A0ABQ3ELL7_9HYPH|nr:carbon-nitrogen hydrolase family protein [Pseudovibrio japonicus]GHB40394.1 apolipoprotein N-acyltransferase [Pseudovibrio japonicus]